MAVVRIVGGVLGGRTLRAPKGDATRPTSDRVREALFNILGPPPREAPRAPICSPARAALGLEALSRGCVECVFVERAAPAADVIEANLAALGLGARAKIMRLPVASALGRLARHGAFDWIFVDPPYAGGDAVATLAQLGNSELLAATGVVVVEHDKWNLPAEAYQKLALEDRRRYGDTQISLYRCHERTT